MVTYNIYESYIRGEMMMLNIHILSQYETGLSQTSQSLNY